MNTCTCIMFASGRFLFYILKNGGRKFCSVLFERHFMNKVYELFPLRLSDDKLKQWEKQKKKECNIIDKIVFV